jgi:hypothetical protein
LTFQRGLGIGVGIGVGIGIACSFCSLSMFFFGFTLILIAQITNHTRISMGLFPDLLSPLSLALQLYATSFPIG